jgi:hypothetical protein
MANTIEIFKSAKVEQEKLIGENNYFKSQEEIAQNIQKQEKFISNIDFSDPANFALFGSAEEYYKNAINYINSEYPFDKSQTQKLKWINALNNFEYYIFTREYPKYSGYLYLSESQQIKIYSPTKEFVTSSYETYKEGKKYFLSASFNLDTGINFESWMKFPTSSQETQVINFWNVVSSSASGLSSSNLINLKINSSNFIVSGNNNYTFANYIIPNDEWHHYSFIITGSDVKLFVDGQYSDVVTGFQPNSSGKDFKFTKLGILSSSYIIEWSENTGSYQAKPVFEIGGKNYIYLDETRLWNEPRTPDTVGRSWFTQIDGNDLGDPDNNNLIFYYKFNEGWSTSGSYCLDYSGYETDGLINNYDLFTCRLSGSAFDGSGLLDDKDPGSHIIELSLNNAGTLKNYYDAKILTGSLHDEINIHSLYKKFPSWILEEEEELGTKHFKQIIQIVSSYFDDLYNKISEISKYKHQQNTNDLNNIYPFYDKILSSFGFDVSDLFTNVDAFEKISSRNEKNLFDQDIEKVKNAVLQNIYNNLSYILKSKGTEKSIKSFLRSYGVNENLVKVNLYANAAEFNVTDRSFPTTIRKKTLNLINSASVYCTSSQLFNSNTDSFTFEASFIFPRNSVPDATQQTSSVFGFSFTDSSRLNRYLDAYLTVESSSEGPKFCFYTGSSLIGSSSFINSLYDDSNWNFALRLRPDIDDLDSAPVTYNFILELTGANYNTYSDKTFFIPVTASYSDYLSWNNQYVNFYLGARNINFTGSNTIKTSTKSLYCNYWDDYLSDEEIISHNKDITNYGVNQ